MAPDAFLDFVKQALPRLPSIALDMSEAYSGNPSTICCRWSHTSFIVGDGTRIPLPDDSQDAVTSIFMFHELPPKVRRGAFREFARVLKPAVALCSLIHFSWATNRITTASLRSSRRIFTSRITRATSK